jgi:hypothetical protein
MRRVHRIVLLVGLLAPVLAGCADFDMDKLDIFGLNEKKKLPGDRKDVFPEGVPGVTQGVPPEYLRGNQPSADAAQTPGAQPAAAPEQKSKTAAIEQEEPKPKPKRKPKPQTAARQPTEVTVQRQRQDQGGAQQQPAAWPEQSQQQQPQQAQQGQAPWPSAGQSSSAPWPSSPAPGTFSR